MRVFVVLLMIVCMSAPAFSATAVRTSEPSKESSVEFTGYFVEAKPDNIIAVSSSPDGAFSTFYIVSGNLSGLSLPFGTSIKLVKKNGYVTAVEVLGGKK